MIVSHEQKNKKIQQEEQLIAIGHDNGYVNADKWNFHCSTGNKVNEDVQQDIHMQLHFCKEKLPTCGYHARQTES